MIFLITPDHLLKGPVSFPFIILVAISIPHNFLVNMHKYLLAYGDYKVLTGKSKGSPKIWDCPFLPVPLSRDLMIINLFQKERKCIDDLLA